jgi:hypothetical protein
MSDEAARGVSAAWSTNQAGPATRLRRGEKQPSRTEERGAASFGALSHYPSASTQARTRSPGACYRQEQASALIGHLKSCQFVQRLLRPPLSDHLGLGRSGPIFHHCWSANRTIQAEFARCGGAVSPLGKPCKIVAEAQLPPFGGQPGRQSEGRNSQETFSTGLATDLSSVYGTEGYRFDSCRA